MKTVNPSKKTLSGGRIAVSVIVFILNLFILLGIALLMVFLNHSDDFAKYIEEYLPVVFFTVGCLFLLFAIVYFYYCFERAEFLADAKNIWLLFFALDVCIVISFVTGRYFSVYARPVALLSLLVLFLIGYRDAIFLNGVYALIMFVLDIFIDYATFEATGFTNEMFFSLMLCFIVGYFAVFIGRYAKTRLGLLGTGVLIAVPTSFAILFLKVSNYVRLSAGDLGRDVLFGLGGCIASGVLLMALLPVLETVFGVLTDFRLRELTSSDSKLLKRLKEEANGTFNHTVQVAQLVEACASALGENVELARAATYYHDVGKLGQPEYYTENQTGYNPHDEITPELSADIIRSHTRDGYSLILAYHLPQFLADVAIQHHGTMPIKYFYTKALRMSDGDISVESYSYTGPKPESKIAAVVMIADASEAATRSMTDRSPEKIERVVRSIIEERMDLGQFTDCPLTLGDLNTIKDTLVSGITGMYHHRVKYPDVRFTRKGVKDNG